MTISSTAGSKVSIGTPAIAVTSSEFAADDYTAIANITDVGEAGSEAEILVGKFVDQEYARKLKGSRDNGTMTLVVARDSSDPGYAKLVAAEKTPHAYNFCIELDDRPAAGSAPKNSKFYFSAIVASRKNTFSDGDNIVTTAFALAVNGAMIEIAASAA